MATTARCWGPRRAGRRLREGDFAWMAAVSTSSPHAYWGSTRCPPAVAADPPTIIRGVSSLCGTRGSEFVKH